MDLDLVELFVGKCTVAIVVNWVVWGCWWFGGARGVRGSEVGRNGYDQLDILPAPGKLTNDKGKPTLFQDVSPTKDGDFSLSCFWGCIVNLLEPWMECQQLLLVSLVLGGSSRLVSS